MNRKQLTRWLVTIIVLGPLVIKADPFETWLWDDPTAYENNQPIPIGDLVGRTLHCGMIEGGPYPATKVLDFLTPPSIDDMAFVVAGVPGTYYCVMTVSSLQHVSTSEFSNEVNFTVLPGALGFVPNPPANLRLQ